MPPVPVLTFAECVRAIAQLGYVQTRQKGSHARFEAPGRSPITVPKHSTISRGTLRNIIRQADLTVEAFLELL